MNKKRNILLLLLWVIGLFYVMNPIETKAATETDPSLFIWDTTSNTW